MLADQTSQPSFAAPQAIASASDINARPIAPPLRPWLVWLLAVVTLTFYTPFWLARTARDARTLRLAERSAPLWFFGGFVALPLFFMFPRLADDWEAADPPRTTFHRHARLLAVAAFVAAAISNAGDRLFPFAEHMTWWLALAGIALYAVPFALAQAHVNRFKEALPDERLSRRPYRASVVHWGTLLTGIVFVVGVSAVLLKELAVHSSGLALASGEVYHSPDQSYSVRANGAGWRVVSVGSVSDGTADLELLSRASQSFVIVFTYGRSQSLQDLAADRLDGAASDGLACVEERTLETPAMKVRVDISCEGHSLGNAIAQYFSIVETDAGLVETSGYAISSKATFERVDEEVRTTTRSLEVNHS